MDKAKSDQKIELKAEKRTVFGKKLKKLRRDGLLPANIYGENFASQAVTIPAIDFYKTFKKAGETHIVYLTVKGENQALPVLIHNVQRHPVNHNILHFDLRKVDLQKKLETEVPIKLVGESDAIVQKKGVLQTISDSVVIEALPQHIPSAIEVDITVLKEVNDEVKVKDLKTSAEFAFKEDPEKTIVRITEHKEEETAPQIEAVAPEITGEKPAKGEAVAEGEAAPAEEKAAEAAEKKAEEPAKES